MEAIIKCNDVSVSYGPNLALDKVSFEVYPSSCFALLGPNGAGKSSLMKSLLGLVRIDQGTLEIRGMSCQNLNARRSVAYLPEKFQFYEFYKVKEVLQFYASMNNVPKELRKEQIENAAAKVGITKILNQKVNAVSKGQLQRTGLATLLIGEYDLFFLDEPFSGLDPIAIKEMKEVLKNLVKEGKTLLINSHILSEVEQLCTDMMIINEGKKLISGNIHQLKKEMSLEDYFYEQVKKGEDHAE